ncbi:hypothetical protein NDU88_001335 [Pleurodeles waltl]|uniref:Uncharacterized protein n=1 Tax=Pleurodeles waltl TaxID=8319 RepID=A0AAV7WK68_PLEWA|nr:hypothetical protein NDU88_001335 [Pleurodeles waltl]
MPPRPAEDPCSGCEAAGHLRWCRRGWPDPQRKERPTGGDSGGEGLNWGCKACFLGSLPGMTLGVGRLVVLSHLG